MAAHVPPVADERDGLLQFLRHQRQGVRYAAYGLSDAEARQTPSASTLSIGGLLKHLASTERWWMARVAGGEVRNDAQAYLDTFRMGDGDTLDSVLDDYDSAAEETEKAVAGIADLGQPVPVPRAVPWMPQDVDAWSVRWVLLHLIEETARHAGHADVVRESLDGAAAISLLAAAEGWPDGGWITPWRREAQELTDAGEGER